MHLIDKSIKHPENTIDENMCSGRGKRDVGGEAECERSIYEAFDSSGSTLAINDNEIFNQIKLLSINRRSDISAILIYWFSI